ncbi:hypothetical protein NC652_006035 [Populus alba x Populus x berolinensis]|nr:hypothetical protein NC652_006035 [Populus alba x Populus x berolinensis]
MSFVGIKVAVGMVVYSLWVMLGAKSFNLMWSWKILVGSSFTLGPNAEQPKLLLDWMWMEVEDGLWVLFGFNGAKRRPIGIMSNELLVQEKMGRDWDKYHTLAFLPRTKENNTTICTAVRYSMSRLG